MSTPIVQKVNKCYNIDATRFYGGKGNGVMAQITIGDGKIFLCIALKKRDVIDFCAKIIESMNEIG